MADIKDKNIIEGWFIKSRNQRNYFDKFSSLWTSFNHFYATELETYVSSKTDRNYINFMSNYPAFNQLYTDLLTNNRKFLNSINEFISIVSRLPIGGYVRKLQDPTEVSKAKRFTNIEKTSFSHFLEVIYLIRCNLIHGWKELSELKDIETVKMAYRVFSIYVKELYKLYGYNV